MPPHYDTLPDSRPSTFSRSNATACVRCRQRKKKCDRKLPTCSLCERAGVECIEYDSVADRQVPRSYILSLEERVAYLELTLQQHNIHYDSPDSSFMGPITSPASVGHDPAFPIDVEQGLADPMLDEATPALLAGGNMTEQSASPGFSVPEAAARATMNTLEGLISRRPHIESEFSKILLAELMKSRTNPRVERASRGWDDNHQEDDNSSDLMSGLYTSQASLPTVEAARNLTKAYFQWANLGMPLIHEPTFHRKLEFLYTMELHVDLKTVHTSRESRMAVFFVCEVFAVALIVMQKQDPSKIPVFMADRYHQTALAALSEAGLPTDIEGVQSLLLLGQYYYHHPTTWAVWKTAGAALRLAVELGLHQDPKMTHYTDALAVDTVRRVFWVAYSMDRGISIALGLPSCIPDGAITTKFPSPINDEYITVAGVEASETRPFWAKSLSIHLFRYRKLQSEIRTMLYEHLPPKYILAEVQEWQDGMRKRLYQWYEDVPTGQSLNQYEKKDIENFKLSLQRALLLLYQPSLNIPEPSGPSLLAILDISSTLIQLYRRLFREYTLTIYWQAIEGLSSAGTALIYSYINSSQVRDLLSFHQLESLLSTCSSVLWGMVEHFPAYKEKRDAFDILAGRTLADLSGDRTREFRLPEIPFEDNVNSNSSIPSGAGVINNELSSGCGQQPIQSREAHHWARRGNPLHREPRISDERSTIPVQDPSMCNPTQENEKTSFDSQIHAAEYELDDDLFRLRDWQPSPNANDIFAPTWI